MVKGGWAQNASGYWVVRLGLKRLLFNCFRIDAVSDRVSGRMRGGGISVRLSLRQSRRPFIDPLLPSDQGLGAERSSCAVFYMP